MLPVNVQKHGVKSGDAGLGGYDAGTQIHPEGRGALAAQPDRIVHIPVVPGGVQQLLQQSGPVLGLHQGGGVSGGQVQQLPPAPEGQIAQAAVEGQTADALSAQLQHRRRAGQALRQHLGGVPQVAVPGLQDAGGHAVHRLVAGDGQLLPQRGGPGKRGGGAGKGHSVQRDELSQPFCREQAGKPLAPQALHGTVQQGGSRGVELPEHHVHHLSGAVGDDLRQQERDAAALEGPCELVQMLGHGGTSPFDRWNHYRQKSLSLQQGRQTCPKTGDRSTFAKMHKKYYLCARKVYL